jgi:hypothetical protein
VGAGSAGSFRGWGEDLVEWFCGFEGCEKVGAGVEVFEGDAFFDYCVEAGLVESVWLGEVNAVAGWGIRSLMNCQENESKADALHVRRWSWEKLQFYPFPFLRKGFHRGYRRHTVDLSKRSNHRRLSMPKH